MAELSRAVASLRIVGDDLLPDEMTSLLGVTPTRSFARGDEVSPKRLPTRWRGSASGLSTRQKPSLPTSTTQVAEILSPLTPDLGIWRDIAERFGMDLFCGLVHEARQRGTHNRTRHPHGPGGTPHRARLGHLLRRRRAGTRLNRPIPGSQDRKMAPTRALMTLSRPRNDPASADMTFGPSACLLACSDRGWVPSEPLPAVRSARFLRPGWAQ
jgi:hypothetical protein